MADTRLRQGWQSLPNGATLWIPEDLGFDWAGKDPMDPNLNPGVDNASKLLPVGTIYETPLGRWRYFEGGGTIAAGRVAAHELPDVAHDNLTPAVAAIGATEITISDTITLVLNEYVGGQLFVEAKATAGAGYSYPIIKHTAPASGAVFTIGIPLSIALDASAEISLVKSPYQECLISTSPAVTSVSGVTRHPAANGDFGWMQTKGLCAVLGDTALLIAQPCIPSVNVDGAVGPLLYADTGAVELVHVGRVVNPGADTEMSLIDLQLE